MRLINMKIIRANDESAVWQILSLGTGKIYFSFGSLAISLSFFPLRIVEILGKRYYQTACPIAETASLIDRRECRSISAEPHFPRYGSV